MAFHKGEPAMGTMHNQPARAMYDQLEDTLVSLPIQRVP
jgi:hypothetical protein